MPLESTQPMYKDGQANASQATSSTKNASASVQNKSQVSASAPREMKDGENSVLKKEEEGRLILAKARDENGDKEGDSDSDSDSDEEPTWSGGNPRAPMRPPYSGTRPTKPPGGIRR